MSDQRNVVDMKGQRTQPAAPTPDFWGAQVDLRLSQIERMLNRLEWQIWLILCSIAGVLVLEVTAPLMSL